MARVSLALCPLTQTSQTASPFAKTSPSYWIHQLQRQKPGTRLQPHLQIKNKGLSIISQEESYKARFKIKNRKMEKAGEVEEKDKFKVIKRTQDNERNNRVWIMNQKIIIRNLFMMMNLRGMVLGEASVLFGDRFKSGKQFTLK